MSINLATRDDPRLNHLLQQFCRQEALPVSFCESARCWFLPLADAIAQRHRLNGRPLLIGINGCQGSGKSTLAALLATLLPSVFALRTAVVSIDDFYFTRAERQQLAEHVHPLLATRGVPGTHDMGLMQQILIELRAGDSEVKIPRFDKSQDDRADVAHWQTFMAPVDVVIVEGWCIGVASQTEEALVVPVNLLEAEDDVAGCWRRYVNDTLAREYRPVFDQLDLLLMLRAPSFDCVHQWRVEQERRLAQRLGVKIGDHRLMSAADIMQFIQHYQRLTEHALVTLPAQSDLVFQLDAARSITGLTGPLTAPLSESLSESC